MASYTHYTYYGRCAPLPRKRAKVGRCWPPRRSPPLTLTPTLTLTLTLTLALTLTLTLATTQVTAAQAKVDAALQALLATLDNAGGNAAIAEATAQNGALHKYVCVYAY